MTTTDENTYYDKKFIIKNETNAHPWQNQWSNWFQSKILHPVNGFSLLFWTHGELWAQRETPFWEIWGNLTEIWQQGFHRFCGDISFFFFFFTCSGDPNRRWQTSIVCSRRLRAGCALCALGFYHDGMPLKIIWWSLCFAARKPHYLPRSFLPLPIPVLMW